MPIKLDCPRCKTPLAVPNKKAGGYANCPHCKGRFWVPKPDAVPATQSAATGDSEPARPASPVAAAPSTGQTGPSYSTPPVPQALANVQPPAAAPPRRVARFITADTTDSTFKLAEDGKLPELRLKEPGREEADQKSERSTNPLLLLVLLCMSVVMSTVLVLVDFEPQDAAQRERTDRARTVIEEQFFANLDPSQPLAPYQVCLREAARAHSIGDRETEKQRYREVLAMLRAERGKFERGLTGSPLRDEQLEQQISTVLSQY
ncbi:MAG: hypothetical protein GXY83_29685 [Rhodopirellula sp.]|nr:hypothetical protein [Rhodopirellula sp.]